MYIILHNEVFSNNLLWLD